MPRPSVPPRTVGSAWAPRRRSTRAGASLTRDAIIQAAVRLVDREGIAGLTMRNLASEADAGVTTLYWHVTDKEEMLDLVADAVLGEVELPEADATWQDQLRRILSSLRHALLHHRDMALLLSNRPNVGPNALRVREALTQALRDAGLPDDRLRSADRALLSYTIGSATADTTGMTAAWDQGTDPDAVDSEIAAYLAALPPDEYPSLVVMSTHRVARPADDEFLFGLDCLLAGIEAGLPVRGAASRRRPGVRRRV